MLFLNVITLSFVLCFVNVKCANILGLFPLKLKSHYIIFNSILTELANRGHNVTSVNPFPKSKPTANFTDIDLSSCSQMPDLFSMDLAHTFRNPFNQIPLLTSSMQSFEQLMECEGVRNLMKSKDKYDLLITESFSGDVMMGFTSVFQGVPHMLFVAGPIYPWTADVFGNPDNPSYVSYPHTDVPLSRKSTFYERFYNTIYYVLARILYSYYTYTVGDPLARQHFGPSIPSLTQIAKNVSLILEFSHFSVNMIQPLFPGVVDVAGLQIKDVSPLPKDIKKFIDESEHGVIYFCMGSLLEIETMPEDKRNAFLHAFSKLPQRVLWKWGAAELPGKTDNIFISKWMPQRDILAHPKVKLFISHGGALGLNEAVYEGVPVVGIPMYADQTTNLKVLQSFGAAEILYYPEITDETAFSKIQQVLQPEYAKNMKKVSEIYKDRPMSPMDTAIYWIEYVIRHKGAHHLKSAAADLPFYQYLLLDVIAFILLIIVSFIVITYYILKRFVSLFRKKPKITPKKKLK